MKHEYLSVFLIRSCTLNWQNNLLRKLSVFMIKHRQQTKQNEFLFTSTFPEPMLFSYVQLRTKLHVLLCMMHSSLKQQCQPKQNNTLRSFASFRLTNNSSKMGKRCFPSHICLPCFWNMCNANAGACRIQEIRRLAAGDQREPSDLIKSHEKAPASSQDTVY